MNSQPLLSVIVPVYNGAEFLGDALASIRAQGYAPLEILVMDDGSTDETADIARAQSDVTYFALTHRGLPATRQRGLDAAQGALIAFLDVDDLWSADKLQQQLALLHEKPDTLIVNGYTQLMRLVETNPNLVPKAERHFELWGEPTLAFSFGSALFRREAFERVGGFDETQSMVNDLDWFLRAREKNAPMLIHRHVTQYYRRHTRNMSNNTDLGKQQLLRMLQKSLARRSGDPTQMGISLPALEIRAAEGKGME